MVELEEELVVEVDAFEVDPVEAPVTLDPVAPTPVVAVSLPLPESDPSDPHAGVNESPASSQIGSPLRAWPRARVLPGCGVAAPVFENDSMRTSPFLK